MLRRLQNGIKKSEGFTLIELLVVIVILGILAAIVTVNVSGARGLAVNKACKQSAQSLALAAQEYYADNGAYPASLAVPTTAATSTDNTTVTNWFSTAATTGAGTTLGSYLRNVPKMKGHTDPSDYFLAYTLTNSTTFTIVGSTLNYGATVAIPGCSA